MAEAHKLNRKIHWLLLILGIGLIVVGIFWGLQGGSDFHLILTTIGGTLIGSSAGWLIEEYYRKNDERTDALSLFQKTFDYMQRHLRVNELLPAENALQVFRKNPLHFYYTTYSDAGTPFWNYVVFDFTDVVVLGRLIAKIKVLDITGVPYEYDVELYRLMENDPIIIAWRPSRTGQASEIALLDPGFAPYQKFSCGILDHEDWGGVRRLSKAILSRTNILPNTAPGPLIGAIADKLQAQWDIKYQKGVDLFGKGKPA